MHRPSSSGHHCCGWVAPPPQPHRAAASSTPTPSQQSAPAAPATPAVSDATPVQFQFQLRRRLPSLATAALALCSGMLAPTTTTGPLPLGGMHPPAAVAVAAPSMSSVRAITANTPAKPAVLLLPIIKIEASIDEIGALIKDAEGPGWQRALDVLSEAPFTKPEFKKTFNAYSDTIYRPTSFNGYTETPPSSQQSIQYLYRNEILTNLEELREELGYLIQERAKGSSGDWADRSGLDDYWGRAKAAMNKYLSLAPLDDVQNVREAVANQRRQAPKQ